MELCIEDLEMYQHVVERANDGIAIIQDGILVYFNPRMLEMVGYVREEATGTEFTRYLHPDVMAEVTERYRMRMAGQEVPQVYESALRHKDGRKLEVEINGGVVGYQGKPADLVLIRDITERKKAERELNIYKEHLEELVEEKAERLRHLQAELVQHNLALGKQIEKLKDRLRKMSMPEAVLETHHKAELSRGVMYLVECRGTGNKAFSLLRADVDHGIPGLVLTRTSPEIIKKQHDLGKVEVVWLSKGLSDVGDEAHLPLNLLSFSDNGSPSSPYNENLLAVVDIIRDFIGTQRGCTVLLDGIEYLLTRFSTSNTMNMVYDLSEVTKGSQSKILFSYYPDTLDNKTLTLLKREMEWIPAKGEVEA